MTINGDKLPRRLLPFTIAVMHPTVFTIPWLELPIRSYGLMLMIGFLGGTYWAAKRAARVKADPDLIINLGFASLLAAVVGARLFYVIHYWDTHFAGRGIRAAFDITAGGMEFYGGFIGAFLAVLIYLLIKRVSIRLYFDIIAPSVMFGMGMARIGCFLNGCCWGAACEPNMPWAVRFPYASPAAYRQWEERVITYPAELVAMYFSEPSLIPRDDLEELARRPKQYRAYQQAQEAFDKARAEHVGGDELSTLRSQRDEAYKAWRNSSKGAEHLAWQQSAHGIQPADMLSLAKSPHGHTRAVHPAQLYSSIDGLLIAVLLNAFFYRRRQHGAVGGLFFLLYPIVRFCEEIIRSDNPHDVIGLTVSQFISVSIFVGGVLYLIAIYRMPANAAVVPSRSARRPQKAQSR